MKFIKFFFWAAITSLFCIVLNSSFKIGDSPIPAIAPLFDPVKGFWNNAESSEYPDQDITMRGIRDEVTIQFDNRMVPHIFANNLEDALFAQGYVEAYHRLFQMDISTRSASGRLAEVLGPNLIAKDKSSVRIGMRNAAEKAIDGWKKFPKELTIMASYTAGVNSYIDRLSPKDYPFEFKLLGYDPEPWTLMKSSYLLKAMSLVLCGYEEDVSFSNALKMLGQEDFDFVFPEYDPKNSPIIPKGTEWQRELSNSLGYQSAILNQYESDIERYRAPQGVGSNNWAVAGSKTTSGNPIFANDPHLKLSLPSVWYEIHIHTPEFSSYGVTLLGMPGIMIGFNQDAAWGETNVGHDVMDWHKIRWIDEEKTAYTFDNKYTKTTQRVEEIKVKNKESVFDTVAYTVWGPVAKDTSGNTKDISLQWLPHLEPDRPEFLAFIDGMQAKNYDEYLSGTQNYIAPAQNFAYADRHGEVALRINGKLPIKQEHQGRFISEGGSSDNGWRGFIPRSENPQTRNPERGYISSANQWSTDETYPYYYNGNFEAYRGRMVNRLLDSMNYISPEDMMEMQMNNYSIKAEEATPSLLSYLTDKQKEHRYAKILKQWDYNYTSNSEAPIIFNYWWYEFQKSLWDEFSNQKVELPFPDNWRTMQLLKEDTDSKFWDKKSTKVTETKSMVVSESWNNMVSKIDSISAKKGGLTYSNHKKINVDHLLQIPALSATDIITDGHGDAINAVRSNMGPSWRMVVDLDDTPKGYGVYPGGQSGNPGSPFYKNMIEDWSTGKHQNLHFPQSQSEMDSITLFTIKMTSNEK